MTALAAGPLSFPGSATALNGGGLRTSGVLTRRKLIALATVGTGVALAGCRSAVPAGPPSESPSGPAEGVEVQRYSYGDHPSQFAELTVPPGSAPVPVVVVVHGGFWQTPYGADLGQPLAADLVAEGYAALNVEYRRVGRSKTAGGGGWPTTMTDVAAAVDALATDGQRLAGDRLDLTRVVGLGHSAGGQLVGWLAGRPTLPASAPGAQPTVRLSGLVAQAGVMDLVGAADEGVGGFAVPGLMGGSPAKLPDPYAWASPLARVPLGVPSVCVHGTADTNVPLSQSERFVAAAVQAGDTSELRTFDGDHFDPITVGTPAWTLCTEAVAALLDR